MFGFLIKKWFFDFWDNFLPAIAMNLAFIALMAIPITLPAAVSSAGVAVPLIVLVLGIVLVFVYTGGVFAAAGRITDYHSVAAQEFVSNLRAWLPASLILAGITIFHAFLLSVAVPVYNAMDNVFGLFALAVLFWMSVIWWMATQYFFPVRGRLTDRPMAVIKKSFILTFDNTGFTVGILLGSLVIVVLSVFTAFMVPGIAGLAIWYQTATKLRLYKYDYLEEHPEESRKDIPWDALLLEDRERVGKRTLKGMIFPWKD